MKMACCRLRVDPFGSSIARAAGRKPSGDSAQIARGGAQQCRNGFGGRGSGEAELVDDERVALGDARTQDVRADAAAMSHDEIGRVPFTRLGILTHSQAHEVPHQRRAYESRRAAALAQIVASLQTVPVAIVEHFGLEPRATAGCRRAAQMSRDGNRVKPSGGVKLRPYIGEEESDVVPGVTPSIQGRSQHDAGVTALPVLGSA